jgi:hypothetical protein
MIDAPATWNRAMEWQSWTHKISTELYYETMYAFTQGDPWQTQYYFGGNGDGTLFYPGKPSLIGGTHDVPVASLRLKMIREGMEDFEYLAQLAQAGDRAMADAQAMALAPTSQGFTSDPQAIDDARHAIALRIEALTAVDAGAPPQMMDDAGLPPADDAGSSARDGGAPVDAASRHDAGHAASHDAAAGDGKMGTELVGGCSTGGRRTPGVLAPLCLLILGFVRRRSRR